MAFPCLASPPVRSIWVQPQVPTYSNPTAHSLPKWKRDPVGPSQVLSPVHCQSMIRKEDTQVYLATEPGRQITAPPQPTPKPSGRARPQNLDTSTNTHDDPAAMGSAQTMAR
ncbi:hypothetical protein E2C01_055053 [Portunus trituberculatus]|uniref:Uncharacterized protein n=1 Tax=Portunus trituberculatus TaxID=210409 RepID=A0A5B7GLF1_PORTR|nr:hypothetical protein [Portunus trituberculatus]